MSQLQHGDAAPQFELIAQNGNPVKFSFFFYQFSSAGKKLLGRL